MHVMMELDVNYVAILVAGIANMALGAFWYSPAGFGEKWMKLSKITKADIEKAKPNMGKMYGITFLGALVMALVLAHVVPLVMDEVVNAAERALTQGEIVGVGALTGAMMWLGFVATVSLGGSTWGKRPWALYWLDAGYWLVSLAIMGVILAVIV